MPRRCWNARLGASGLGIEKNDGRILKGVVIDKPNRSRARFVLNLAAWQETSGRTAA
jgi:hypothetical protein